MSNVKYLITKILDLFRIRNWKFDIGNSEGGQALVTVLFFMIIAITVTTAAIIMLVVSSTSTSKLEGGINAYYIAESGVENAILRLLRDPNYSGETITVGTGTAVILVTGSSPKTITSTGTDGNFTRKIQAVVGYTNSILTINSWKEIQ